MTPKQEGHVEPIEAPTKKGRIRAAAIRNTQKAILAVLAFDNDHGTELYRVCRFLLVLQLFLITTTQKTNFSHIPL